MEAPGPGSQGSSCTQQTVWHLGFSMSNTFIEKKVAALLLHCATDPAPLPPVSNAFDVHRIAGLSTGCRRNPQVAKVWSPRRHISNKAAVY